MLDDDMWEQGVVGSLEQGKTLKTLWREYDAYVRNDAVESQVIVVEAAHNT
jgi:hypothetical protein